MADANRDGSSLIAAAGYNMVVVTFNYRVGPYGFLASKEVVANGSLNNGLKDQRFVLEWIQKNIALVCLSLPHLVLFIDVRTVRRRPNTGHNRWSLSRRCLGYSSIDCLRRKR